jgi:hypothetical protein
MLPSVSPWYHVWKGGEAVDGMMGSGHLQVGAAILKGMQFYVDC